MHPAIEVQDTEASLSHTNVMSERGGMREGDLN